MVSPLEIVNLQNRLHTKEYQLTKAFFQRNKSKRLVNISLQANFVMNMITFERIYIIYDGQFRYI